MDRMDASSFAGVVVADGYYKQSGLMSSAETDIFTTRLNCLDLEEWLWLAVRCVTGCKALSAQ